jgi:hypothetical protein
MVFGGVAVRGIQKDILVDEDTFLNGRMGAII